MTTKENGTFVHLVINEDGDCGTLVYACVDEKAAADKVLEIARGDMELLDIDARAECLKALEADDHIKIIETWSDWTRYNNTIDVYVRELLVVDQATMDLMEESLAQD